MKQAFNKNKNHSRMFLSGIFNACRGVLSYGKQQCVEDPRLHISGVVPSFNQAFTLIELLVVVLIIGILAAVALPQYNKAVEKARATEAMILVRAMAEAEKVYYLENGTYTTDIENLSVNMTDTTTKNWEIQLTYATHEEYPLVYARRKNTTMNVDAWYIYYTLKDNQLWCGAVPTDELGNRRCRTIGRGEAQKCTPAGAQINCYLIQ